jgi:hypothetical protein
MSSLIALCSSLQYFIMFVCVGFGFRSGKAMPVQLNLDHVAPATRLLEKRRQMVEVQDALDAQKEEYAKREEAFKRREEQLRKKDLELQESLIRFNKFLKVRAGLFLIFNTASLNVVLLYVLHVHRRMKPSECVLRKRPKKSRKHAPTRRNRSTPNGKHFSKPNYKRRN